MKLIRVLLPLVCLLFAAALWIKPESGAKADSAPQENVKVVPSTIVEDLEAAKKRNPKLAPGELAARANLLLAQKGFNHFVDSCKLAEANRRTPEAKWDGNVFVPYGYELTLAGGGKRTFQIMNKDIGGPCGCPFQIPMSKVTRSEIVVVTENGKIAVKRPPEFFIGSAELVGNDLKKTLRSWHLPIEVLPLGISAEGTKLYIEASYDDELNELVLELSEDGTFQFRAKSEIDLQKKGELIDPGDGEFSLMRFKVKNKIYKVKFTAPCT